VIHAQVQDVESGADNDRVLTLLMAELPLKTAVKLAAELTGQARNTLYERALVLKAQSDV
jgi:16S rRNA (cytidine1402-2'-O)-methyltransferase